MREVRLGPEEFTELSTEILGQGRTLRFKARGFSMWPFVRDGDTLTVQSAQADALRVGDIAFYIGDGDSPVAHRVIARQIADGQLVLRTRGDALSGAAELVRPEAVLGRVVSIERGDRSIAPNRGLRRLTSLAWIRLQPLSSLLARPRCALRRSAARTLDHLQGLRPYQAAARKVLGKRVQYCVATPEDAAHLRRLYGRRDAPEFAATEGSPPDALAHSPDRLRVVVATVGEKIAAAATISRREAAETPCPDRWLLDVRVRARYRGAGVDEGLLRMALEIATQEGAALVCLMVPDDNPAGAAAYRDMGFEPTSIPELDRELRQAAQRGERRHIIIAKPLDVPPRSGPATT